MLNNAVRAFLTSVLDLDQTMQSVGKNSLLEIRERHFVSMSTQQDLSNFFFTKQTTVNPVLTTDLAHY